MGERANNMGKMLNNPKQRNIYFLIIGVVAVSLGAGLYVATRDTNSAAAPAGAAVATVPSTVNAVPGGATSAEYNEKVREKNNEDIQKALQSNSSFQSTITSGTNGNDASPIDLIDKQQQEAKRAKEEQALKDAEELRRIQDEERNRLASMNPTPAPVVVTTTTQVAPLPVAQVKPAPKPKYGMDDYILIAALSGNTKSKAPFSEYNFSGQANTSANNNASNINSMDSGADYTGGYAQGNNSSNTNAAQAEPLVKAGTILNAILETAVNSNEPSPVLAKIISGPLKGTRLIGSVQTVGEKVVLQFSVANIPAFSSSSRISAVAVNPETARTALASDVDHHYFRRYGILLASSFLSGWAQAIQQNNETTTIGPFGNVITVPNGNLSSKDINRQALGNVGTEISQEVRQQNQNLKPTITVDSGIAIGILTMEDFVPGKK